MRLGIFFVAAMVLAVVALAAPPTDVRTVTLICQPGWRGSAAGQYGGVGFSVQCDNGRGVQRLRNVVGTSYSARVGVESDAVAADCAYSGDAASVSETCIAVQLSIQ